MVESSEPTNFQIIAILAIDLWLKENDPDADWIAFDDERFTIDKRLILIDFHKGIDYDAYRSAVDRFEPKSPMKDLAEW